MGEGKKGQRRSRGSIQSAVQKSVRKETGKQGKAAKKASRWIGADKKIAEKRPRSVLDGSDDLMQKKAAEAKARKAAKAKARKEAAKAKAEKAAKGEDVPLGYMDRRRMKQRIDDTLGKSGATDPAAQADLAKMEAKKWIDEVKSKDTTKVLRNLNEVEWGNHVEFEGKKIIFTSEKGKDNAAELIKQLSVNETNVVPRKLFDSVNEIRFVRGANKHDPRWAIEYDDPDFQSLATGGSGRIQVYREESLPIGSFKHECGHNFAQKMWEITEPPPTSKYGAAQRIEAPVTEYGANSPAEDFADACEMYKSHGRYILKPRHQKLMDDFPHKFNALEELLGD